jgi:hypothetical protein
MLRAALVMLVSLGKGTAIITWLLVFSNVVAGNVDCVHLGGNLSEM